MPYSRQVLVEDALSTAGSSEEALAEVQSAAGYVQVPALVVGLDRQEIRETDAASVEFEKKHGIPVYSMLMISDIFEYLKKCGMIPNQQEDFIMSYWKKFGSPQLKALYKL